MKPNWKKYIKTTKKTISRNSNNKIINKLATTIKHRRNSKHTKTNT